MSASAETAGLSVNVVLVHPAGSKNVGAVCRAMKSMGVTSLIVVLPSRTDWCEHMLSPDTTEQSELRRRAYNQEAIRAVAVHSFDVYERCRFVSTLREALADTHLAVGFSRRSGRFRHTNRYTPATLATQISTMNSGTVHLVFGNERSGLTTEDLSECSVCCVIPSAPVQSSLNLSHAVQIACYELYRHQADEELMNRTKITDPVSRARVEEIADYTFQLLGDIGALDMGVPQETRMYIQSVISRAMLNDYEAKKLHKMLRKIRHMKMEGRGPGETG